MSFLRSIKFYANIGLSCFALVTSQVHGSPLVEAGEVTFALGKAYLNGKNLIKTGQHISEGDVIETLGNGHVHIRFVDNGLVSVRPDSRLSIEHYSYDAEHPNESIIKFNLNEGVMRSISGTGAKAARDKFRLNTPIAAIGVRGTDFVVKASNDLVQAIVNEGAIVVAPFSNGCSLSTLGPCQTNSVELTSQAKQLLEFSVLSDTPRLIPLSATFVPTLQDAESTPLNNDSDTKSNDLSGSTDEPDTKQISSISTSSDYLNIENSVFERLLNSGMSEADARTLLAENQANKTINDQFDKPNISETKDKITWARLWAPAENSDTLISGMSENLFSHMKVQGTVLPSQVAKLPQFTVLFTDEDNPPLDVSLGEVAFNLSDSQVNLYTMQGPVEQLLVRDGSLIVDFTRGTFDTELVLDGNLASEIIFNAAGDLDKINGKLTDPTQEGKFAGMADGNGKYSTYMFYKDTDVGTIEGVTVWGQ